jgi:hypothetical protein
MTEQILNTGLYDKIIRLLHKDDLEVKREALFCLTNAARNAPPLQVQIMVDKGAIKALLSALSHFEKEAKPVLIAL